jgi:predicted AAA+ superfamily ATPase
MSYRRRILDRELKRAAGAFGALLLTGPRRSGKTTLLRRIFPHADYRLLEDPDELGRVRADPRGFLDALRTPVILDEIQSAPELMNYIRTRLDANPRQKGRYLLTGSQEAPLMKGVSESMAGRAAIFQLLPFSIQENPKVSLFHGGFPEVLERPANARIWFQSYLQTYLERDVRGLSAIKDLATFRRFLSLLASRTGGILNKSGLASPLGVSVPTLTQWLSILEITGQILVVPPYFENFGRRLIKSPKVYFMDSGLACHLLNLDSARDLERSPFYGPIFEGFVAAEIAKAQINHGRRRELYYFRDQQGLEVDFLVPGGSDLTMIEAKASRTPLPAMAGPMLRLRQSSKGRKGAAWVVHPGLTLPGFNGLGPGAQAAGVADLANSVLGFKK